MRCFLLHFTQLQHAIGIIWPIADWSALFNTKLVNKCARPIEPPHDKTNKMACVPSNFQFLMNICFVCAMATDHVEYVPVDYRERTDVRAGGMMCGVCSASCSLTYHAVPWQSVLIRVVVVNNSFIQVSIYCCCLFLTFTLEVFLIIVARILIERFLCISYLRYICGCEAQINKWAPSWVNLFCHMRTTKDSDQRLCCSLPRSLISAFVVRFLDSIISLVSISKISRL